MDNNIIKPSSAPAAKKIVVNDQAAAPSADIPDGVPTTAEPVAIVPPPPDSTPSPPEPAPAVAQPSASEGPNNVPRFGALQPKIDAHPLFSGTKEPAPKRHSRLVKWTLALVTALIIIAVVLYLLVDSGTIKGASHLPFHIFKQPVATTTPIITAQPTTGTTSNASTSTNGTVDQYAGWKSYTLTYEKISFKYPSSWTITDTSANKSDTVQLTGANGYIYTITTGGLGHPSSDFSGNVLYNEPITFAHQQAYLDFLGPTSTGTDVQQVSLSKSTTNGLDTFTSNTPGENPSPNTGGNIQVLMGKTSGYASLTALKQSTDYSQFKLWIESMTY